MARRGVKPKTLENSRKTLMLPAPNAPTSRLKASGRHEFARLVDLCQRRGILERIDISILTEAARAKQLLDQECRRGPEMDVRAYVSLASLRKNLLGALGLCLQSSRATSRAHNSAGASPDLRARWAHALGGE
jgi:hypothetical protein